MGEKTQILVTWVVLEKEDGKIKPELEWGSSVAWTVKPLGSISSTGKLFPCSQVEQTLFCVSGESAGMNLLVVLLKAGPLSCCAFPKIQNFCQVSNFWGRHPEAAKGVWSFTGSP